MILKNKVNKYEADELVIKSIGACLVDREGQTGVVIAYKTSQGVSFCFMPVNREKKSTYEDFFTAIKKAEKVKHLTYGCEANGKKNIYLCRETEGKITDIVERNFIYNRFEEGFSEIAAGRIRFKLTELSPELKPQVVFNLNLTGGNNEYEQESAEYAIVNAYNACLLGEVFDSEELNIETKYKRKVNVEVKEDTGAYVDENVLLVRPVITVAGGAVDYYETEKFYFIDGEDSSLCAYKIKYTNHWGKYIITRI